LSWCRAQVVLSLLILGTLAAFVVRFVRARIL
jgi:hypothetical protein